MRNRLTTKAATLTTHNSSKTLVILFWTFGDDHKNRTESCFGVRPALASIYGLYGLCTKWDVLKPHQYHINLFYCNKIKNSNFPYGPFKSYSAGLKNFSDGGHFSDGGQIVRGRGEILVPSIDHCLFFLASSCTAWHAVNLH